jgi:hypothetical protein
LLIVVHVIAPDDEYMPDGHALHHGKPLVCEYVPAAQTVQLEAPAAEYWPAAHAVHIGDAEDKY